MGPGKYRCMKPGFNLNSILVCQILKHGTPKNDLICGGFKNFCGDNWKHHPIYNLRLSSLKLPAKAPLKIGCCRPLKGNRIASLLPQWGVATSNLNGVDGVHGFQIRGVQKGEWDVEQVEIWCCRCWGNTEIWCVEVGTDLTLVKVINWLIGGLMSQKDGKVSDLHPILLCVRFTCCCSQCRGDDDGDGDDGGGGGWWWWWWWWWWCWWWWSSCVIMYYVIIMIMIHPTKNPAVIEVKDPETIQFQMSNT